MEKIQAPTNCPSCGSLLEWSNDLLYCKSTYCFEKQYKRIEHFAKTLKIKGLGPSSIEKLGLRDIDEIYCIDEEEIAETLSSEKIAQKLYSEIENSKSAPLNLVLAGFSIPLIGKTATAKLATVCSHITDISEATCAKAGLGPKATENLMHWIRHDFLAFYDGRLPFDFKFVQSSSTSINGVVCISGKLNSFKTKAEATKALESQGYEVKSSLTKQVTILVNESGIESSKTKQARDNGVTIVTNLKDLIGE